MRVLFILFLVGVVCWGASARADDGIAVQMRVEGTIPKPDDPIVKPFTTDTNPLPKTYINGQFGGDEFCVVVTKDKARAVVWMNFGGDKKLKEQAAKLAGQRVVVECKGEYSLTAGKRDVQIRLVWYKEDVAYSHLSLTVTKIEAAK
jgi:hypothetical protein